jgi:eukaryotic-like serine/threonine-protein kinase
VSTSPRLLGGRYEVGELIGRGGMAEVHVGHDTRLGRTVAIKMLRWDLARDTSFLARFRREAQSAAGLNNPAIVAVYDSGEEHTTEAGGTPISIPYIVMEYVEGRTLRELLNEKGHLDPDEAARITAAVLTALAYSHDKGIVHRDIKPANVMVTPNGAVKVMDFGIARALADTAATMTQSEAVIGTARYLSPEQAQGTTVDARSDLYSTGCLLYELLTGRTPFVGEPVSLVYQHIGEAPQPPSAFQHDVPPALDAVTLHALAKDRSRRYQHASQFRADLQAARSGRVISEAARRTAAGSAVALAGGTGAAAAGAAVGFGRQGAEKTPQLRTGDYDPDDATHQTAPIPVTPPERRRRWPYVLLVLAVVAALIALGLGARSWLAGDQVKQAPVPQLVGLTQPQAERALHDRGFPQPKVQTKSDQAQEGQVIQQNPDPGLDEPVTTTVTIVVSSGPNTAIVPDVVGSTESSAKQTIKNAGLTVGSTSEQDSPKYGKGQVISTDPKAGRTLRRDDTVDLVISTGRSTVPNVLGDTVTDAAQKLKDAGFEPVTKWRPSAADPNTVIAQQHADEHLPIGTKVTITAAQPQPQTETRTVTETPTPSSTTSTSTPSDTSSSSGTSSGSPSSTTSSSGSKKSGTPENPGQAHSHAHP